MLHKNFDPRNKTDFSSDEINENQIRLNETDWSREERDDRDEGEGIEDEDSMQDYWDNWSSE